MIHRLCTEAVDIIDKVFPSASLPRLAFPVFCLIAVSFPLCTVFATEVPAQGEIIIDVPFYPQEEFQCGPAALASVINYLGRSLSPDKIAKDLFSENARGTLNLDMAIYAASKGFETDYGEMTLERIRESIDGGVPVIVLLDRGLWMVKRGHYAVVVGYSVLSGALIVHDGADRNGLIPEKDFLRQWSRSGRWALILKEKPEDKGDSRP